MPNGQNPFFIPTKQTQQQNPLATLGNIKQLQSLQQKRQEPQMPAPVIDINEPQPSNNGEQESFPGATLMGSPFAAIAFDAIDRSIQEREAANTPSIATQAPFNF